MIQLTDKLLRSIVDFYALEGELKSAVPFGNGNINSTFLLTYDVNGEDKKYVLQMINKYVFHHPDELMVNAVAITDHLRKKAAERGGDTERGVLKIIPAANGASFFVDENGEFWRITRFVDHATSHETVSSLNDFYQTGLAFGAFQRDLCDFPADTLYYTIPGFHDTRARLEYFKSVLKEDRVGRAKNCQPEIDFILGREDLALYAMESYEKGELPLRVTHNDTKLSNLMIDDDTGKPVCVLDLDTVMPGFAMMDFGDAIRSGTCTAVEDEPDLSKVHCDLALYEAFAKGFIETCRDGLTHHELETLPMGALTITYELAMRFLTDYLVGDLYFKTTYPEHNLVRTRSQIKMVRELEANSEQIKSIVAKFM